MTSSDPLEEARDELLARIMQREQELGVRLEIDRMEWVGDSIVAHLKPWVPRPLAPED